MHSISGALPDRMHEPRKRRLALLDYEVDVIGHDCVRQKQRIGLRKRVIDDRYDFGTQLFKPELA